MPEKRRNLGLMEDGERGQNGAEVGGMVPSAEMRDNSQYLIHNNHSPLLLSASRR